MRPVVSPAADVTIGHRIVDIAIFILEIARNAQGEIGRQRHIDHGIDLAMLEIAELASDATLDLVPKDLAVLIRITPPVAFRPNSVPCGPRRTW